MKARLVFLGFIFFLFSSLSCAEDKKFLGSLEIEFKEEGLRALAPYLELELDGERFAMDNTVVMLVASDYPKYVGALRLREDAPKKVKAALSGINIFDDRGCVEINLCRPMESKEALKKKVKAISGLLPFAESIYSPAQRESPGGWFSFHLHFGSKEPVNMVAMSGYLNLIWALEFAKRGDAEYILNEGFSHFQTVGNKGVVRIVRENAAGEFDPSVTNRIEARRHFMSPDEEIDFFSDLIEKSPEAGEQFLKEYFHRLIESNINLNELFIAAIKNPTFTTNLASALKHSEASFTQQKIIFDAARAAKNYFALAALFKEHFDLKEIRNLVLALSTDEIIQVMEYLDFVELKEFYSLALQKEGLIGYVKQRGFIPTDSIAGKAHTLPLQGEGHSILESTQRLLDGGLGGFSVADLIEYMNHGNAQEQGAAVKWLAQRDLNFKKRFLYDFNQVFDNVLAWQVSDALLGQPDALDLHSEFKILVEKMDRLNRDKVADMVEVNPVLKKNESWKFAKFLRSKGRSTSDLSRWCARIILGKNAF